MKLIVKAEEALVLRFTRRIVELFWVKTRENAAVLDFLAVVNFDFTRKIVKKKIWVKNS